MSDRIKGKAKEVAGKVTGDKELQSEGKAQELKGRAEGAIDDAKERFDDARGGAEEVADDVRDAARGARKGLSQDEEE